MTYKSCYTCKHFIPDEYFMERKWCFFGKKTILTADAIRFARCALSMHFCSVSRMENWSDIVSPCDSSGRAWEPKDDC